MAAGQWELPRAEALPVFAAQLHQRGLALSSIRGKVSAVRFMYAEETGPFPFPKLIIDQMYRGISKTMTVTQLPIHIAYIAQVARSFVVNRKLAGMAFGECSNIPHVIRLM